MPWIKGEYPPSYRNLPARIRNKAVEFANALVIDHGAHEELAIVAGAHYAKEWAKKHPGKR